MVLMKIKLLNPVFKSSLGLSEYYISRRSPITTSSWKPFILTDELTVDVKKAIEAKWGPQIYGVDCPAESDRNMQNLRKAGKRKYVLSMFPYPSGSLHMGHVRVYTLSDVLARLWRLRGYQVVHPMGWDAFGLPAENAARDHGIEAEKWTRDNIQVMKNQIISMGCSFDWNRELATCDPSYYNWTQWIFLKLWEHGLAYKKEAYVFWDPVDQTVLAEEQVDDQMRSWRSGAKVEKKLLSQWFIRTAVFAKELAECLDSDDLKEGWRDIVLLQKHWIGTMKGYFSDCPLVDQNGRPYGNHFVRLWLSSPEIVPSAKYVILSSNHYLVKGKENILNSFDLNGLKVQQMNFYMRNPVSGELMPIFSSESEEVMPTIPQSCDGRLNEVLNEVRFPELVENEGLLSELDKLLHKSEKPRLKDELTKNKPKFIYHFASLKLRDWLISRQRKWGTPIPAVNCLHCGKSYGVPPNELPILPNTVNAGVITKPLCEKCGTANAIKETDTLDTFFDSSWYYLRYLDPMNGKAIFDENIVRSNLPVDIYIGGKEHATLHLYYARFMAHFLHKLGLIPVKEPFKRLIPVGYVLGETYIVGKTGKYLKTGEYEPREKKFVEKTSELPVIKKWEKMSKSKFNGTDPNAVIQEFGIDATRLLSMADVAPTSPRKWDYGNLKGFLKFQQKLWSSMQDLVSAKESIEIDPIVVHDDEEWKKIEDEIFDARNYYLKGITHNYVATNQISVVVSKLQGLIGSIRKYKKPVLRDSIQYERVMGTIIITLYPIMPAFSAQLWHYFREVGNLTETEFDFSHEVWRQQWPGVDNNYNLELIVELMDKEYAIKVPRHTLDTMDETIAIELAFEDPQLEQFVESRNDFEIKSLVVKPGFEATLTLRHHKWENEYRKQKQQQNK